MAQKLIVLDLGSYSCKSLVARFPVTGIGLGEAKEGVCPSALEAKTRRADQLRIAKEQLPGKRLTADSVTYAFPAEKVLNRSMELPFTDRRKIDQVLGFELENHVPMGADELAFDYVILEKKKSSARLFAGVVPTKDMEELKETFGTLNIDPRFALHQGVALASLAEMMGLKGAQRVAFVDIGHRKTVVTLAKGVQFAGCRTIMTGGYDLTKALADEMGIEPVEAEKEKHQAHLFPAGEATAVGRVQQVADCLQAQLVSLARDLHQTFRSLGEVDRIYLFGGGARLTGVDQFLSSKLGRPVELLYPSHLRAAVPEALDALQYTGGLAVAYAAVRTGAQKVVNFRQGEYAYVGDLRFLRGRMVYLSMMLPSVLALMLVPLFIQHAELVDQEALLAEELAAVSERVLGEPLSDPAETLARLEEVPSSDVWTVFPDMTAPEIYWAVADIIAQIDGKPTGEPPPSVDPSAVDPAGAAPVDPAAKGDNPTAIPSFPDPAATGGGAGVGLLPSLGAIPGAEGAEGAVPELPKEPPQAPVHRLEMNVLNIAAPSLTAVGPGTLTFEGDASSVATMELFITKLGQHRCFKSIQRTQQSVLEASEGKKGWSRFRLEITVTCPSRSSEAKEEPEEKSDSPSSPGAGKSGSPEKPDPSTPAGPAKADPSDKSAPSSQPGAGKGEKRPAVTKAPAGLVAPGGPTTEQKLEMETEGGTATSAGSQAAASSDGAAPASAAARAAAGTAAQARALSGAVAPSTGGAGRPLVPARPSGNLRKDAARVPATNRIPPVPGVLHQPPVRGGE